MPPGQGLTGKRALALVDIDGAGPFRPARHGHGRNNDNDRNIPNAMRALVPGYEFLGTKLMKQTIRDNGVASIQEPRIMADVNPIGCQMTVDLFGFDHADFIGGIEYGGAATFFEFAGESDICLYI